MARAEVITGVERPAAVIAPRYFLNPLTSYEHFCTKGAMKKSSKTREESVARLQAAAKALADEGASADVIADAVLQVFIESAQKKRQIWKYLDEAAHLLMNLAEQHFQKEKNDRADARAKRLGLTED